MTYDRLLKRLDAWASAREVEPGRIEVTYPSAGADERTVEIVMTPDQWDDMASVMWGSDDAAAEEVRRNLLELGEDEHYLVFGQYELNPSSTPTIPPDPEEEAFQARFEEWRREHPDRPFGAWFAHRPRAD